MPTIYKAVLSHDEFFELTINKHKGKWVQEPMLAFFPYHKNKKLPGGCYLWDNDVFLRALFENLKKYRFETAQVLELKEWCKFNGMRFNKVRKSLLRIYKKSKEEKMWK